MNSHARSFLWVWITYILVGEASCWKNVALSSNGGVASCRRTNNCHRIIDGYWRVSLGQYHEFNSPKVGSWIKIQFDKAYHLTFLRILPAPLKFQGGIKHLNVTTSDGSYLQVLNQKRGARWETAHDGQWFTEVPMDVVSNNILITVESLYGSSFKEGFHEIEVYTGNNPCPPEFTWIFDTCLFYQPRKATGTSNNSALNYCQQRDSELLLLDSTERAREIRNWLSKVLFSNYGSSRVKLDFWTGVTRNAGGWDHLISDAAIWGPNEPTNFDNETHVVLTTKLTGSRNNFLLSDVIGASHTGLAFCQYSE